MGILPILDDQVKTVGGTDKTFANDLYRKCMNHPRFSASKLQLGARQFQLQHYAGPVQYVRPNAIATYIAGFIMLTIFYIFCRILKLL